MIAGLRDYQKAMPHHLRLAKAGVSFCFFPEGGRTHNGTIQPAKGGVAYLAECANYPIIPVGISGPFRMSASEFFLRRRKLVVRFGAVIKQDELQNSSVKGNGTVYKGRGEFVLARVKELIGIDSSKTVQVERKDVFDEMEIERLWEIYDKAFEPINKISPCKQSFDRVHFIETLHDPTVRKYVLAKEPIGLVGIGFITNDLKNTPWISEDYFRTNFPKEHGNKALYYFMGLAIHDAFRGNKYSLRLLEHIIEDLPPDVVMGFDHSRNVNPLLHHFTRIVRQAGQIRRLRIDEQHYHVVRRKE